MEGKDTYDNQRFYRGGRSGRGRGRGWRDEAQHADTQFQGRWDDRRANFQDGRHSNQQWRKRESGSDFNQNPKREQQQFDLRQNLNQGRQQDQADRRAQEDLQKDKGKEVPNKDNSTNESQTLMRPLPLKEGVLDIVLSITSGRGLLGIKFNNDRNHLEL
jgi:hypothetical protein